MNLSNPYYTYIVLHYVIDNKLQSAVVLSQHRAPKFIFLKKLRPGMLGGLTDFFLIILKNSHWVLFADQRLDHQLVPLLAL